MLKHTTINCKGNLIDLTEPKVMGIVNVTDDSFYANSRCDTDSQIIESTKRHLEEGAIFIDLGAYSTRPGCKDIPEEEEGKKIKHGIQTILHEFPNAIISVDTFRASVAQIAIDEGAAIINDITGGADSEMFNTIAKLQVPYILMHMKGTPQTMQQFCNYENMMEEILKFFAERIENLKLLGVNDIIVDPGFGFSKDLEQNYQLMNRLEEFSHTELPILVGISRKSMIYKYLGGSPETSLNGTTILNTIALTKGANILRVHDTAPAMEAIKICQKSGLLH